MATNLIASKHVANMSFINSSPPSRSQMRQTDLTLERDSMR